MIESKSENHEQNTTDATVGESLRLRVETRKSELETAIAKPSTSKRVRGELENALNEVTGLLTGDLDRIPKVVGAELNRWLEASKHLDEHHPLATPT
ncbi:MAG: hypothetical protein ABI867_29430 [Kofleriaceae bacterium]